MNKLYEKLTYRINCINILGTVNAMKEERYLFELDVRSRKPIYEQLVDKLKDLIINEVLKSDEKLPSVRVLAKELTINPNTIQKAYRELERQGYSYSVQGRGSFVTPQIKINQGEKVEKMKQEMMKIFSEAIFLGMKREEIEALLDDAENLVKGGDKND